MQIARTDGHVAELYPVNSNRLTYIEAVSIRVFENESFKAVVLVLKTFDDAQTVLLAKRMKGIHVMH
jgi:hypothetical protein